MQGEAGVSAAKWAYNISRSCCCRGELGDAPEKEETKKEKRRRTKPNKSTEITKTKTGFPLPA